MEYKCQKCKKVFRSEEEAKKHTEKNKYHKTFDFKAIGVIRMECKKRIIKIETVCTNCGWEKDMVITFEFPDDLQNPTNLKVLGFKQS